MNTSNYWDDTVDKNLGKNVRNISLENMAKVQKWKLYRKFQEVLKDISITYSLRIAC